MKRANDLDRTESLLSYGVLGDTGPEFDAVVALAAQLCGTASAALGFLVNDRIEIRAALNAPTRPIPREASLSVAAIERSEAVVFDDLPTPLSPKHPFVADGGTIRAFMAVPLIGRDGLSIGVLTAHDAEPRHFTDAQVAGMHKIADLIMTRLELHRLDAWSGRSPSLSRGDLPTRMRRALDDGELVPFLQPIVDLSTGSTVGVEALIRWDHPELGVLAPAAFLPAMEASGLMIPVGRQVRARTMDALVAIRALGPQTANLQLGVNASPIELTSDKFAQDVLRDLSNHGLDPSALMLEVTETAAFVDSDAAAAQLRTLVEAGVAIGLDDYGAGHSSLARLLNLPLRVIKIDRALTANLPGDSRFGTAIASTIAMASDLGLSVIAEGVEEALQASALLTMGCDMAQGWHFGRPEPVSAVLNRLAAEQRDATTAEDLAVRISEARAMLSGPTLPSCASLADPRPVAAYMVDVDRRIRSWSRAAESVSGYTPAEVIGRQCADHLLNHVDENGELLCDTRCPLLETMADGADRKTQAWLRHRNGRLIPVSITASVVRDGADQVIGAIETFQEILTPSMPPVSGTVPVPRRVLEAKATS